MLARIRDRCRSVAIGSITSPQPFRDHAPVFPGSPERDPPALHRSTWRIASSALIPNAIRQGTLPGTPPVRALESSLRVVTTAQETWGAMSPRGERCRGCRRRQSAGSGYMDNMLVVPTPPMPTPDPLPPLPDPEPAPRPLPDPNPA